MTARGRKPLDVDRAQELRDEGLSWPQVAEQMSREQGREPAYQGASVAQACNARRRDWLRERAFGRE